MTLIEFPLLFLVPLLPLIGAVYSGLFGLKLQRRWGEKVIHIPTVTLPWLSFVVVLVGFLKLAGSEHEHPGALYQRLWTWFDVGQFKIEVAYVFDRLSAVMCLVVTFVGSLIHLYSVGYMKDDPSYFRFFSYLNLFLFSMLTLVLADNLILLFVGWEGVGLCSYLLISFWYTDVEKAKAGMKAFIVNRVGDAGFVVGTALLFWSLAGTAPELDQAAATGTGPQVAAVAAASDSVSTGAGSSSHSAAHASGGGSAEHGAHHVAAMALEQGDQHAAAEASEHALTAADVPATSLRFREIEQIVSVPERREALASERWGLSVITVICLLLFLGATGKSAQLPLHVWLPDAMAGPTPVSALIHAATMVTAGVYLLARMNFLVALSPVAMTVVSTVGAITALFAATIGLFQHDIKKVLAYSTVSQLGFMFVAVGAGAFWVGIFHLMTHAFFKACLFLGSGSVINGCHHEQDMRKMGGLRKLMPVTAVTYLFACFAIAGFPVFSGFFSKDEILWQMFNTGNVLLPGGGFLPWLLATLAAVCTSFYVFRSYYMTFSGSYRGMAAAHGHGGHDEHGHGSHEPHESPWTMTVPLIVLAGLATVGGVVGLPHLWGLPNLFEHWLEPVFEHAHPYLRQAGYSHGLEWGLMGLATTLAVVGFLVARWLYVDAKNPIPARLLESQQPLISTAHRVVYNKYYVDEIYDAGVVRRSVDLSRVLAWVDSNIVDGVVNLAGFIGRMFGSLQGLIDRWFVDGLVNLVGDVILWAGARLRTVQTGRIQAYVVGLLMGSVLVAFVAYVAVR